MRPLIPFLVVLLFALTNGEAVQGQNMAKGQVIETIAVEGNQRFTSDAILSYSRLKVGDPLSAQKLNEAIKALIKTSFFNDVQIDHQQGNVVITVQEHRIIGKIVFEGNRKVSDDELTSVLSLKPRETFTRSRVQADVKQLLDYYKSKGRYASTVKAVLIPRENNGADIVFEIQESDKTKISGIVFLGNRTIGDSELRRAILSKEDRWYRFLSSSTVYDPARVAVDVELVKRYYTSRGYADVEIIDTVAELQNDRDHFILSIALKEGLRYRYSDVKMVSKIKEVDTQKAMRRVRIKAGDIYDAGKIEAAIESITERLNLQGLPFVKVEPKIEKNKGNATIALTLEVMQGQKVYVEKINVTGNEVTRDYVVRREFEFVEGDPFNVAMLKRTQRNLMQLGFFKGVDIKPRKGSSADQVILDAEVTETTTSDINFTGSYGSEGDFGVGIGYKQRNLFGRGQNVAIEAKFSERNKNLQMSFSEPYFLGSDVGFSVSGGYSEISVSASDLQQKSYNIGTGIGYKLSPDIRQSWNYNFDSSQRTNTSSSTALNAEPEVTNRSAIRHSIRYDTRDSLLAPTQGLMLRMNNEYIGVWGDVHAIKNSLSARAYFPVTEKVNLAFNLEGGIHHPFDEEGSYIADRFFLGKTKVRGFAAGGIGPELDGNRIGGTKYYTGTAELRFPIPLPIELEVGGRLFADIGAVWDPNPYNIRTDSWTNDTATPRVSIGYGFTWQSPLMPLQFDFGYDIYKQDGDEAGDRDIFRFSMGTSF